MPFEEWEWLELVCTFAVTFEIIASSTIFFLLSSYNKKHEKRLATGRACVSKPSSASLFELPAFRGKTQTLAVPFENTTWLLTFYEHAKLSIMAVTVFPLRFIIFLVGFFGTFIAVCTLQKLGLQKAARAAVSVGGRIVLFSFGFLWINVKGKLASGIGVLVCNHSTFLDGIIWITLSTPRIFAEKANFGHPILQAFAKALDVVLFDRSGSESRRAARVLMANSAAAAYEGKAEPILVFPTGTTTNSKVLITFKDGAFAPGLPVQPAVLHFKFKHCDPCWVFSGPGTLMLVFRLMCQFYNALDVEFLPVHTPSEEERQESHKYARTVQLQIAKALGVPVTEHSVEDLQLQLAAVKANLPAEVGVVGFAGLKDVFSVDANQIKQQMNVFKEMDPKGSGLVGFEEFKASFTRGFHEPSGHQTLFLQEFFLQLTGGEPQMDFRKFLIGLALVNENEKAKDLSKECSTPRRSTPRSSTTLPLAEIRGRIYAQLAFAAFATASDDRISWSEFKELWDWLHPAGVSSDVSEVLERTPSGLPIEKTSPLKRLGSFFSRQSTPEIRASVRTLARKVFDDIAGDQADQCTWDQFSAYSEQTPIFITELRQAFFSRLATDLSSK